VLTRKYGPLPGWGWAAAAAALAGGYIWWRRRHSATSTTSSTTSSTTAATTTSTDYAGEISTLQAEIQQLQGAPSSTATTSSTTAATTSTTGTSTGTTGPAKPKYKAVTASGTESLNKIARANHTSAAAIASFTMANKTHIGAELKKYLAAGNYQARIPKGLIFWVPE